MSVATKLETAGRKDNYGRLAFSWGLFPSSSHFSRVFRKYFGGCSIFPSIRRSIASLPPQKFS